MIEGPVFEAEAGWGGRLNAWFRHNLLFAVALVSVILLAIAFLIFKGMPDRRSLTTSVPLSSPTQTPTISEVVRKGDSYTLIARRAIASYGSMLQPGQALYGETILAQKIKNQPLKTGAVIEIPQKLIAETLTNYNNLSPSQKSKWEAMARNVKF
ncbi:MAG: hypothetical protein AAB483_02470 [Patescibacteria group bacterium]